VRFVEAAGQVNFKNAAPGGFAVHIDEAVVLLDDAVNGGEPQPRSFSDLLGREERFENMGKVSGGDAGACVAHHEADVGAGGRIRMGETVRPVDHDVGGFERELSARRHRVARVHRQIDQNLFDLRRIDFHRPETRFREDVERNVFTDQAAERRFHVSDQVVEVDDLRLNHLFAGEGQKLRGQIARAAGGFFDFLDVVKHGAAGFELELDEVHVSQDHIEHVVEVVRHAAGQPSDGLQLLGLQKLVFQFFPLRLRLFPFGDVFAGHQDADRFAGLVALEAGGDLEPDRGAVFMVHFHFEYARPVRIDRVAVRFPLQFFGEDGDCAGV